MAADEEQVGRAVLPARQRHGALEPGDVDAVGDDLVVAREVAVDEVPGGGADGDPAVQARGVALHEPPAELVGRREAGVGMERGDVHAARLVQEDQRQEWHERLVEVEDVELLALEHPADLADIARRDGDRPDGAVRRHAEALAEADHVALGRPLEAVAAADDPDVVAAQAEVLVEVADVLVHATRDRVDVRRHEADLHRGSSSSNEASTTSGSSSRRGGRRRPPG